MPYRILYFLLFGLLLAGCQAETPQGGEMVQRQAMPETIDFNWHIKPILSDRCFACHGPDEAAREAGLGLHTEEGAFAALGDMQDHYAIVPGDAGASTLMSRIYSDDPSEVMPPPESNLTLTDYEKELLQKWIAQGAEWKRHWAFIAPEKPVPPQVQQEKRVHNAIDRFVAAAQEKRGYQLAAEADKEKLLRRLSFTLRGIPPSVEELNAFLADDSPEAYERMVDQFLDSDAHAERMAQWWMDIARYADTHGYQDDFERVMWPWRDWVIHAFRQNLPYDTFITWQLAGDLLPEPTLEQRIATGFNRNHKITAEGGVIDEEYRVEYVADRVQTVGTSLLGLTMECARCHDHKYDPISQEDFYSTFAFFNSVPEKGYVPQLYDDFRYAPRPAITLTDEEIENIATFINNRDSLPKIELMVMEDMSEPRPSYILERGKYDAHGKPVQPAPPATIMPMEVRPDNNRLDFAQWLFAAANPLTARVAVNQLWQLMFGRGIVATPYDFGNQGALPTHPALLDYLAVTFQEEEWDIRAMLKHMVMSATFRQTTVAPNELLESDPENQWLARASRLRLNAEMIRDQALAASGLLHTEVGGPSVKPYQPEGLWAETTGGGGGSTARYEMDSGVDQYRRSLYTFWKRTVPPPDMLIFDAPTRDLCTVERQETNTPLQALMLLNNPQIIEASKALAYRAWSLEDTDPQARISWMFRRVTSAQPNEEELAVLLDYFAEEQQRYRNNPEAAAAYLGTGNYQLPEDAPVTELAAYALVANTIFNLDEAITRG